MNLSQYINLPVFLISFIFGILIVCFLVPQSKHIYVYPTPDNVDVLQYKDAAGECFEFEKKHVECPRDKTKIEKIPIQ